MIPIRCFTCGKVVANKFNTYLIRIKSEDPKHVLDDMGFTRYCCRRMFITEMTEDE